MSDDRIKVVRIKSDAGLRIAEQKYRKYKDDEIIPFARNTSFTELAGNVIEDRDGPWAHPLFLIKSLHVTTIGIDALCRKTKEFLDSRQKENPMDILSISAGLAGEQLAVICLIRPYKDKPKFGDLYDFIGEQPLKQQMEKVKSKLVVPKEKYRAITPAEYREHARELAAQDEVLLHSTDEHPFLNEITQYVPRRLTEIDARQELIYDLRTKDMQIRTKASYNDFIAIFSKCMSYITSTEKDSYYNVLRGQMEKKAFYEIIEDYIARTFIRTNRLPLEDEAALMQKIDRALFDLYIVQDLIDDPAITDVKITDPYSIRVRVGGRAYLSNVTFIDDADYFRYINGIAVMNNVSLKVPVQTFTDDMDENYILRFMIIAPYISSTGYPVIHIRKVPRRKMMADDLIRAGMMDEKIRDYLIDCGKYSTGVVFAGPPGSGKTTLLNWFLEDAYESSAEILVIQENDELFAYRKGVIFEHVVLNPQRGEQEVTLEQLGQMALVAGVNVFVIGEVKGKEMASAITLSNSGCRTAVTIHSRSARETIDKMIDLARKGEEMSYEQAKRSLKTFETIVYLQDFKVQEITQITGYNEETHDYNYRTIYRREGN